MSLRDKILITLATVVVWSSLFLWCWLTAPADVEHEVAWRIPAAASFIMSGLTILEVWYTQWVAYTTTAIGIITLFVMFLYTFWL